MADTAIHRVEIVLERASIAKQLRANWDGLWQDVAEFVLPTRQFTLSRQCGERLTTRIYNATAPRNANMLAAALHGMLFNTQVRWLELVLAGDDTDDEGLDWMYDTTTRMLAYFNSPLSGFPTASAELALDLVGFGTGINQVAEPFMPGGVMKFVARRLANFFLIEDEQGTVFEIFRRAEMTATDIKRQFRLPTVWIPNDVEEDAKDFKKSLVKRDILHCIRRRDNADPLSPRNTQMPWASIYVDVKAKVLIREGGFPENPYLTPRWAKSPEETYGRSPSIDMLPDIRMVNSMTRVLIQAAELQTRPPIAAIANSMEGTWVSRPGNSASA